MLVRQRETKDQRKDSKEGYPGKRIRMQPYTNLESWLMMGGFLKAQPRRDKNEKKITQRQLFNGSVYFVQPFSMERVQNFHCHNFY